jgi:FtsX-like permease family
VANLVLARTVRRESELAVRSALGASRVALRCSLLAESLVLCGSGVLAALILAWPMVALLGRYAARFLQNAIKEWAYARRYENSTEQLSRKEETNSCPGLTSTTGIDRAAGCSTNHPSSDQALR